MNLALDNFLFGLFFGMGFCIAQAVLNLIGTLIAGSRKISS